jgi:tetratricopeptide (TPR) repeat protein
MPSDDMTSAAVTTTPPSHHSGPGYVTHRNTQDLELDDQLREAVARWLNFVPTQHRRERPGSDKSAMETLEEHASSCREHPFRALWVAHRHLQDPSPSIRVASLVLASEALWWLQHFQDAQVAAQAAVNADPESAQARWRLTVALYRLGRFDQALRHLDIVLQSESRFAPAWALRGQVKVWLTPDEPEKARTDFEAAAGLEPAKWVVPQRMEASAFQAVADAEIARFDSEMRSSADDPNVGIELLPFESVAAGRDPDIRWDLSSIPDTALNSPLAVLGGDFAVQKRAQVTPGTRFVLYQRNIENLCGDDAILSDEIRKSVAELYKEALHADEAVAYKGAPEQHAEAEDVAENEDA